MTDQNWKGLESWERIKWARSQRFESATQAAGALGIKDGTYRAYERSPESAKHTKLDYERAIQFAKRFGVRWEWLLLNEGQPSLTPVDDVNQVSEVRTPNNLKAWREFRGLSRQSLATRASTTAAIITQLENGEVELSEKWLRRLADALNTTAGRLIDHDPREIDPDLLEEALSIPQENRQQVIQILRTFKARR